MPADSTRGTRRPYAARRVTPAPAEGDPQRSGDPWMRHMRRGDFAAAWRLCDATLRARRGVPCWHLPRHQQYLWDGTPLAGRRVLVHCYHGLGDTLQFSRYLPVVASVARQVSVWAQPKLLPLLATLPAPLRLLPLHDGEPGVDRDVDVEIMELPHVFRSTLQTLPATVPYLHASPARLDTPQPRVGLVWRAGEWDDSRSVPFAALRPLVELPVSWYVLQGEPGLAERPDGFGIPAGTTDLLEAARAVRALDLVITIDSMAAHLAGALGTRVWTMLSAAPDWRWMDQGERSPWYPTMRLFRQERPGDWTSVVERVASALTSVLDDPGLARRGESQHRQGDGERHEHRQREQEHVLERARR